MVYCRSDNASLCLSCDRNVHSANPLSKRHSRTLVCDRCHDQPAFVRCVEERLSLCQNCDWVGHGASTSYGSHKRQTINGFTGCPSAAEFSKIWSFVSDIPLPMDDESPCEQGLGLLTIDENKAINGSGLTGNESGFDALAASGGNGAQTIDKSSVWTGSSSLPSPATHNDLPPGSGNPASPMPMFPYGDLEMDEVDLDFENYDELFGMTLTNSEKLLENGGIGSLFGGEERCADPNCQGVIGAEGSSAGPSNVAQPACSNAASGDSVMSIKTEPNLFTSRQASGISFSGVTAESNGGDHQDCGVSSMLLLGETPLCPPCAENSVQSANRTNAVMRYKEKKKTRKFDNRVRYASRKARADVRKRVKGRFVKAGDAYDYDPLSPTRSY